MALSRDGVHKREIGMTSCPFGLAIKLGATVGRHITDATASSLVVAILIVRLTSLRIKTYKGR